MKLTLTFEGFSLARCCQSGTKWGRGGKKESSLPVLRACTSSDVASDSRLGISFTFRFTSHFTFILACLASSDPTKNLHSPSHIICGRENYFHQKVKPRTPLVDHKSHLQLQWLRPARSPDALSVSTQPPAQSQVIFRQYMWGLSLGVRFEEAASV